MNFLKRTILLSLLISFGIYNSSCSKITDDSSTESLEVKVSPSTTYILPLDDMIKCSSSTTKLSPNVIEFTNIALKWKANTAFRLISMTLEMKSPLLSGGKYQCPIAGNELVALMPSRTIDKNKAGTILSSASSCSLRCGAIQLVEGANSASIVGKIKILGIETDDSDNAFPVTQETEVSVLYKKF